MKNKFLIAIKESRLDRNLKQGFKNRLPQVLSLFNLQVITDENPTPAEPDWINISDGEFRQFSTDPNYCIECGPSAGQDGNYILRFAGTDNQQVKVSVPHSILVHLMFDIQVAIDKHGNNKPLERWERRLASNFDPVALRNMPENITIAEATQISNS